MSKTVVIAAIVAVTIVLALLIASSANRRSSCAAKNAGGYKPSDLRIPLTWARPSVPRLARLDAAHPTREYVNKLPSCVQPYCPNLEPTSPPQWSSTWREDPLKRVGSAVPITSRMTPLTIPRSNKHVVLSTE